MGGTGKKYHKAKSAEAMNYGPTFTSGDVIGVVLDFPSKTISFQKNKQDLGVAFNDLVGPVHIAVSMTAKGSTVCAVILLLVIAACKLLLLRLKS